MEKKHDSFFLSRTKIQTGDHNEKKDFSKKRQDVFIKNRGKDKPEKSESVDKKPFDKKTYRLKKYSKKYKLDQWEEQRKKKLLHNYYKDIKNEPMAGSYKTKVFDEDITDSTFGGKFVRHPDVIEKEENTVNKSDKHKKDPYQKAKEQYNKIKEEKLKKQEDVAKAKEEKQQKLQEYKKKKQERFKKLSKKTKKGQPVMTGRLEMLLEKIQGSSK